MVDRFPNMFMIMGPHAALGNNPRSIEYNVEWVTDLIDFTNRNKQTWAEATPEAVGEWNAFVVEKAEGRGERGRQLDDWHQPERRQANANRCEIRWHGTRISSAMR